MTSFNIKQSKHNERAQVPIKGPWQSWLSDDNLFETEGDRNDATWTFSEERWTVSRREPSSGSVKTVGLPWLRIMHQLERD